ncbi:MAG: flavin reductase family protein [Bacteroidia bacterium]|nr:flavin reductase family protein [Bacteroidia bacterium]
MDNFLHITPGTIPTKTLHQYLLGAVSPRPIAFASTIGPDGTPNLAPFSFFNVFSANPPILIFSPARRVRDNTTKHTLENIYRTPEVVVNVVSHSMVEQMNIASAEYGDGVNEFVKAGFTPVASEIVRPPRVLEAPVQMECKVIEIKPLDTEKGAGQLVIAQVVKMHINHDILDEDEMINPHKIDLVGRMGKMYYARASGNAVFPLPAPLHLPLGIDALPETIRNSSVLTGNDLGKLAFGEHLPSGEDIEQFKKAETSLISGLKNANDVHLAAQKMIANGEVGRALLLLLASI